MKVKNRYTDVDDYIATYEPLIFEEAKSQITKEKEEEEVTDWKLGVVKSWSEADDFHFIEFPCEINEGESISQNDLLLLSRDKFADGKILPTFYAFALVEHVWKYFDTPLVRVRLYLAGEFLKYNTDDVKSCPRLFNMRSYICETERQLYFRKQCSLSTIAREYLAIRTLGCLPHKDLILSAVGEDFGTKVDGWKIPTPLREYVENSFNQYQREAITAGLSSKAFVLIQASLWIIIFSYVGNYFWTHYFFTVLGASYTFPSWKMNNVPHTTFLLTHVCFLFYHVSSNMTLRRLRHFIADLPEKIQWATEAAWILALAYFIAYLETLAISNFPYYEFVDRDSMYKVGSLFYAIYFIVSFPMFLRIDEQPGDKWDLPRVAVDALGAAMLVTIILDLWRIFLGPIVLIPDAKQCPQVGLPWFTGHANLT